MKRPQRVLCQPVFTRGQQHSSHQSLSITCSYKRQNTRLRTCQLAFASAPLHRIMPLKVIQYNSWLRGALDNSFPRILTIQQALPMDQGCLYKLHSRFLDPNSWRQLKAIAIESKNALQARECYVLLSPLIISRYLALFCNDCLSKKPSNNPFWDGQIECGSYMRWEGRIQLSFNLSISVVFTLKSEYIRTEFYYPCEPKWHLPRHVSGVSSTYAQFVSLLPMQRGCISVHAAPEHI